MPQRRSAEKDLRKNIKRHADNLGVKRQIKSAIKTFKKTLENEDTTKRSDALSKLYQVLDKAAKKNLIHSNKAARQKSRISQWLKKVKPQTVSQEKSQ